MPYGVTEFYGKKKKKKKKKKSKKSKKKGKYKTPPKRGQC